MLWQQHLALPHQVSEAANWGLVGTAGDGDSGGSGGAGPTCPGAATLLRASWSRDRPWRETAAVAASCPGQEGPRGAAGAIPAHTVGGGGVRGVPGVPQWQVGPGKCLGWASAGVHPWGGGGGTCTARHTRVCALCACRRVHVHPCVHRQVSTAARTPLGAHAHTHMCTHSPHAAFFRGALLTPSVHTHTLRLHPRHTALPMCASPCPHPKPPPGQKQRWGRWLALAMGWLPLPMAVGLGTHQLPQAPGCFPPLLAHFSPPSAGARPIPGGLRGRRPLAPCELPFVILCLSDAWRLGR